MPDYSRRFKFTNPADVFAAPGMELYKTNFIKEKIKEVLRRWPNATLAKVGTYFNQQYEKQCFQLTIYEEDSFCEIIEGDFPCPNQCIPPDPMIVYNNSFDVGSIWNVVNQDNCVYLVVRYSALNLGGPSTCIYGVVAENGQIVDRRQSGNEVYISTSHN